MDHLDELLNASSPTTFAAQSSVAHELRSVTDRVARRRFRSIAVVALAAGLLFGAGAATASAADSTPSSQGDVHAIDVEVDEDCVLYVKVDGQEETYDYEALDGSAVVTISLGDGETLVVVEVSDGSPSESQSCDN